MSVKVHMNPLHIKNELTHIPHPFFFTALPSRECGKMKLLISHHVLSRQVTTSSFAAPLPTSQLLTASVFFEGNPHGCLCTLFSFEGGGHDMSEHHHSSSMTMIKHRCSNFFKVCLNLILQKRIIIAP